MKFAAFNRMPYRSPDLPRGGRWPLPGAHFDAYTAAFDDAAGAAAEWFTQHLL